MPSQITREATFEELDIDSLDLVELAQVVEDEYGVVLKGEDMKELKTVGDAIDLIAERAVADVKRRIVITGLGAVTPLGMGAASLHERWAAGDCGIADGVGACQDFEPDRALLDQGGAPARSLLAARARCLRPRRWRRPAGTAGSRTTRCGSGA